MEMDIPTRTRGNAPPPLPPRKLSHLQQHKLPLVHGSRQAKYNCSCGNNRAANICSCPTYHSILRNDDSPCSYYGRCVEPLAWKIEHELVRTQDQCPLFTVLPKELRDLVFEFALMDGKAQSLDSVLKRNSHRLKIKIDSKGPANDIATNLLCTCRAIYLETWTLPLSQNPYIVYDFQKRGDAGIKLAELLPWQLALIQSLDITLQQTALEGGMLHNYIHHDKSWQPEERHKGVYVAPRSYKLDRGTPRAMVWFPDSFNHALVPGDKEYPRHFLSHALGNHIGRLEHYPHGNQPLWSSAMRVMLARPITHLTLRIQHQDWWTWTDDPNSPDELQHLGLDPSVGNGRALPLLRPTATRMRALAECRRAGRHPEIQPGVGWASAITSMPDLRSLELVLETFAEKNRQLDNIIEAAKTWTFPLTGTQYELIWDEEVGMSSWSIGGNEQGKKWYDRANAFEVRNVGFARRRMARFTMGPSNENQ